MHGGAAHITHCVLLSSKILSNPMIVIVSPSLRSAPPLSRCRGRWAESSVTIVLGSGRLGASRNQAWLEMPNPPQIGTAPHERHPCVSFRNKLGMLFSASRPAVLACGCEGSPVRAGTSLLIALTPYSFRLWSSILGENAQSRLPLEAQGHDFAPAIPAFVEIILYPTWIRPHKSRGGHVGGAPVRDCRIGNPQTLMTSGPKWGNLRCASLPPGRSLPILPARPSPVFEFMAPLPLHPVRMLNPCLPLNPLAGRYPATIKMRT